MAVGKQESRFASYKVDERRQGSRDGEITDEQMRGALDRVLRAARFTEGDEMRDKIMEFFDRSMTPAASGEETVDGAQESVEPASQPNESSEQASQLAQRLGNIYNDTPNSPNKPANAVTWQAVAEKLIADPEALKEFNKMAKPIVEDWEIKEGKAYPVIADGIEDVTEISEYMGEDGQGLRYMEARTLVLYRRDENGNFKKAGGEEGTVAASEVQTLIDNIINYQINENFHVNPGQRPSDALRAKMTEFETLTASLERTMYDMYYYSGDYDKSPEIGAFETATGKPFVFPKNGENFCASHLESGDMPSRPRGCYCLRNVRGAYVDSSTQNTRSPRLGVRRRLRVSRLFKL